MEELKLQKETKEGVSAKTGKPYSFTDLVVYCYGVRIVLETRDTTSKQLVLQYLEKGGNK